MGLEQKSFSNRKVIEINERDEFTDKQFNNVVRAHTNTRRAHNKKLVKFISIHYRNLFI